MQQVFWNMAKYDKCEERAMGDIIQQIWQNMTSVLKHKVCKNMMIVAKYNICDKMWQNLTRATKWHKIDKGDKCVPKLQVWQKWQLWQKITSLTNCDRCYKACKVW